jgi:hypothetical protein
MKIDGKTAVLGGIRLGAGGFGRGRGSVGKGTGEWGACYTKRIKVENIYPNKL